MSPRDATSRSRPAFGGLLFPELWSPAVLAAAVLGGAAVVAYHDSFSAPFILEDLPGIVRNASIRHLWPPGDVLFPTPKGGGGVVGGPLVNLSLALNHAIGGLDVRGYHAVNLLLHLLAAVLLCSVLRRTLQSPPMLERFGAVAFPFALAVALFWTLHPVLTESVTYLSQRAELIAGLCVLLTLYAFVRATAANTVSWSWSALAVGACACATLTNAPTITAPVLVLLYDRAFVAGTFRTAWQRHRALHLALAATAVLAVIVARHAGDTATAFGTGSWEYLLTLSRNVPLAAKLAVWPHPLVFAEGAGSAWSLTERSWQAPVAFIFMLGVMGLVLRKPAAGFLGAWFLLTLAPVAAEATAGLRVYLALIAPVVGISTVLVAVGGRRGVIGVFALALVCAGLTLRRNVDYRSGLALWTDTVAKAPKNARAHFHLANALSTAGRASEAIAHYETALQLDPSYAAAHHNLGGALLQVGRAEPAVAHYEAALRLAPGSADTHVNLAAALMRLDRGPEAVVHYEAASRLGLLAAEERLRFGRALAEIGRFDEAVARLEEAIRLAPQHAEPRVVMGMVLSAAGRGAEALPHFTAAVMLDPEDAGARAALGDALIDANRPAEALSHYTAALRLQPDRAASLHTGMGHALWRLGRAADAIRHYEDALRFNPDDADARSSLARVRATVQRRGLLKN